jgi:hypothetical protein
VIREPVSLQDALKLAKQDPIKFQRWVLNLARAYETEKRGADRGIDGRLYFRDTPNGPARQILFSVKAGHLKPEYVRELRGVVEREQAAIGVLLSADKPTPAMRAEAVSAGIYTSPWGDHPKLQLLTVAELIEGKRVNAPPLRQVDVTFKPAPQVRPEPPEQLVLPAAAAPSNPVASARKGPAKVNQEAASAARPQRASRAKTRKRSA